MSSSKPDQPLEADIDAELPADLLAALEQVQQPSSTAQEQTSSAKTVEHAMIKAQNRKSISSLSFNILFALWVVFAQWFKFALTAKAKQRSAKPNQPINTNQK